MKSLIKLDSLANEVKQYSIRDEVENYIDDMRLAWTPATLRSESYRLSSLAGALDGNPLSLWGLLEERKLGKYTKAVTWTRVCTFWDWLLTEGKRDGQNPYKQFKRKNSRLFKNVYVRSSPRLSYSEANKKIEQIKDLESKFKARQLLQTGMRYSESFTLFNGYVTGKSGKRRRIFSSGSVSPNAFKKSYATFRRRLAAVGLKPHDLRKICLSELVNKGANEFELCAIAGWSNLNTAASYIRTDEKKLSKLMEEVNNAN